MKKALNFAAKDHTQTVHSAYINGLKSEHFLINFQPEANYMNLNKRNKGDIIKFEHF